MVFWALIALSVQMILGMFVNLFVTIPAGHPGAGVGYFAGVPQVVLWAVARGALSLKLHVVLGVLLFVDAIVILVAAIRARAAVWSAALALFGVFAAAGNGASFLIYGHGFSSLFMTIGLAIALAAYAAALYSPPGRAGDAAG